MRAQKSDVVSTKGRLTQQHARRVQQQLKSRLLVGRIADGERCVVGVEFASVLVGAGFVVRVVPVLLLVVLAGIGVIAEVDAGAGAVVVMVW